MPDYDMVIATPEALKAWADEKIRLINAKKQNVTLIIKSVSPPVAENIRRWLRYADVAIANISKARSRSEIVTNFNVVMADYEKIVTANLTKEAYTTAKDSGVKLTGKKTGSPTTTGTTAATTDNAVMVGPGYPTQAPTRKIPWLLIAVGVGAYLLLT
jgi:hypothetical protein